ncbi:hypothetical protein MBLNU230_g3738t1 [Neophaeotheca triangularis]
MPGVPPDAAAQLKRAFKGLFKRNKRDKAAQQQQHQQQQQPHSTPQPASTVQKPPPDHQQAPEVVEQRPSSASKPLPPTHPLATGQHATPHEAVPSPAAAPDPNVAGGPEGASKAKEMEAGRQTEHVAPVEKDSTTATPVKEIKGIVEGKEDSTAAQPAQQTPAAQELPPAAETSTAPTAAGNENARPSQATPTPKTAADASAPPPTTSADSGKILATETPSTSLTETETETETKQPQAAPGMSATSGPLEAFPEGGDHPPAPKPSTATATPAATPAATATTA